MLGGADISNGELPSYIIGANTEELTRDELLVELRYLRAEVDYLKKLKALAQQKKKQK
ncbi:hypothetical protein KQ929_07015 [Leclercia pneumoniae]|uniref:Transposase n=1 Tax=Leclercia pneumoniae TaxID=2815358 RepID=A0ABX8K0W5_9ENTR|nr:hypothetical protein JZ655_13490 [Leclercia pneumoniae]QWW80973.1 hypothetical protein KQ929_07015 [Leclercia pneumoniae]